MVKAITSMFVILISALLFEVVAAQASDETLNRIKPIGQVKLKSAEAKDSQQADQQTSTATQQIAMGENIYNKYCKLCHASGLAGAPKTGDKAAWQPRLKDKTIEDLVETAKKGLNAIPPKGTCMSCSDEQLQKAIEYMLPKTK